MAAPYTATKKKQRINAVLNQLKNGKGYKEACEAAGITRDAFWRWRKADPDLAARAEALYESHCPEVEESLMKRALGYEHTEIRRKGIAAKGDKPAMVEVTEITKYQPPDVGACIFILCNRQGIRWKNHYNNDANLADPQESAAKVMELMNEMMEATIVAPPEESGPQPIEEAG